MNASDFSVQGTNDDAQVSKLSCARLGYFRDDFNHHFVKKASRRSPLINRGYYSRHAALRQLLESFLKAVPRAEDGSSMAQVLVLGAGFDTRWWQLHQDSPQLLPAKYLEVDFKEVTKRKAAIVAARPELQGPLENIAAAKGIYEETTRGEGKEGAPTPAAASAPASAAAATSAPSREASSAGATGMASSSSSPAAQPSGLTIDTSNGEILSERYSLIPVDLRSQPALLAAIEKAGLARDRPTYILSECVLVYMEPQDSANVVSWLAGHFQESAALVVYEQINPYDAFGRQMCSNLEGRGCPLKGVTSTPTPVAHMKRMTDGGWETAECRDMDQLYKGGWLDVKDKARAESLEMFDEFEEWHMIQEHYCITIGLNTRGENAAATWSSFGFGANSGGHSSSQPQSLESRQEGQRVLPLVD